MSYDGQPEKHCECEVPHKKSHCWASLGIGTAQLFTHLLTRKCQDMNS